MVRWRHVPPHDDLPHRDPVGGARELGDHRVAAYLMGVAAIARNRTCQSRKSLRDLLVCRLFVTLHHPRRTHDVGMHYNCESRSPSHALVAHLWRT